MLIGELLLSREEVFTPAIPTKAANAIFGISSEYINGSGSKAVRAVVQTKNFSENLDSDWTDVGGTAATITITATTLTTETFYRTDLLEQVRMRIWMDPSGSANQRSRVFVFEPSWKD